MSGDIGNSVVLSNGQRMPLLNLGTWQASEGQVFSATKKAIDAGYRGIDTAEAYYNEAEIGKAIKEKMSEGTVKREDLFITTKLASTHMTTKDVVPALQESVKRLQLAYVDLYLVHGPVALVNRGDGNLFPINESSGPAYDFSVDLVDTWREMEKCVEAGLTKSIGLSNFNSEQINRVWNAAKIKPVNLQVECHALFPQDELFAFCQQKNISLSAYAPIGSPGSNTATTEEEKSIPPPVLITEPLIKQIGDKYRKTPAQVLLRNLIQRGIIVLPKSVTDTRITENSQVFDFVLSSEDMKAIAKLGQEKKRRLFVSGLLSKSPEYPFHIPF